jgi:thiol-disulfide isomerase/thioredoxin
MIERTGIAILIIGLAVGSYQVFTRWQVARLSRRKNEDGLLGMLKPGIPGVIYFWSESCAPCKLVQKPALEQLQADLGPDGVQVVAVNALERPELADAWGVLGLPTTFIVDSSGQPRRVNHGVVRAEHLKHQIEMADSAQPIQQVA